MQVSANRFRFRAWHPNEGMTHDFLLGRKAFTATWNEQGGFWIKQKFEAENADVILMQSTGLLDKNGVEIFEGDILDKTAWCNGNQDYENGAVVFGLLGDSDGWRADSYLCWRAGESSLIDVHGDSMIVGNIYQNPELLIK